MIKRNINIMSFFLLSLALGIGSGCKKGTFDINNASPNAPSTVPPQFSLPSAEVATASLMYGGNADILNTWMGYWAVSGDYTVSPTYVLYQLNSGTASGNWDAAYLNLANYNLIEKESVTDPSLANYGAVAVIMEAFVYQRIVDLYNNAPYTEALSSPNYTPAYTSGSAIYTANLTRIDSAINVINNPPIEAVSLGVKDVMFGGDMDMWAKFANTLKLKMALRLTQSSENAALIQSALAGLTTDDFLAAEEDAAVNPGYSSNSNAQESPQYYNIGYTNTGSLGANTAYWRANNYAINFYNSNNDPRVDYFYEVKSDGKVTGRALGSTALEHNDDISGVNGVGIVKSANQDAIILPAFESLFLQAEAAQRGYITGDAAVAYNSAVSESFRYLGIPDYDSVATTYVSQSNPLTNFAEASDKITTIITQKWAACNAIDPLESFSDWRRLKIPSDLPVSIYPGNTATHIPYRLEYPTTEQSYNTTNEKAQGAIDIFNSKIFWMP